MALTLYMDHHVPLYGIVYAHQLRVSIGRCIDDLEIIATVGDEADLLNEVKYLPL